MATDACSRPYADDADAARMRRFLQEGWRVTGTAGGLFHVGDLTWQAFMYTRETFRAEERIRLWERADGDLAGFAWYYPKGGEVALQIDPRLWGSNERWAIAAEMLLWGEERHRAEERGKESVSPLIVTEFESDTAFAAFVTARGYAQTDDPPMRFHRQSLSDPVPAPALPDGFTIEPMLDGADLEQRVAIHREVWHPSRFTVEGYRQLRANPWYDPELDLVAVASDGTFAAYCICWHDEVNRSGLFEPVGAREAFRGRGLTKAVLMEALRRLRARGCDTAYVLTDEDRLPAVALYRAAGFELVDRWIYYRQAQS